MSKNSVFHLWYETFFRDVFKERVHYQAKKTVDHILGTHADRIYDKQLEIAGFIPYKEFIKDPQNRRLFREMHYPKNIRDIVGTILSHHEVKEPFIKQGPIFFETLHLDSDLSESIRQSRNKQDLDYQKIHEENLRIEEIYTSLGSLDSFYKVYPMMTKYFDVLYPLVTIKSIDFNKIKDRFKELAFKYPPEKVTNKLSFPVHEQYLMDYIIHGKE